MYLIHKQGGYFYSISKMVEEALGEPCVHTSSTNDKGIWVLFFTSFLSGFYKTINSPYIVIQTEPSERTFNRYPEYKLLCDNAVKVLDFSKNLEIRYSNSYRLDCEDSKEIDVLFYGVLSHRRKILLDKINVKNKVIFHTSPPLAGKDLWKQINNSKIVLSISCYDDRYEPDWVRIAPLLSNRTFVIAEEVKDHTFNNLSEYINITNYNNIPTLVNYYIENPIERILWSDKGFDYIRQHKTKII